MKGKEKKRKKPGRFQEAEDRLRDTWGHPLLSMLNLPAQGGMQQRSPGFAGQSLLFIMLLTVRYSEIHIDGSCDFRLSPKRNSRISDEHSGRGSSLPISKGHITIITDSLWAYAEGMLWCQELPRGERYTNEVPLPASLSPTKRYF